MKPSPSLFFSSVILALTLLIGACDPLAEDDLPKNDWTVESVTYYPNSSPPLFKVIWGGETDFNDNDYFYERDISTSIDFSDIIAIPGLTNLGKSLELHNGFVIKVANGGQPTGDAVITYYDTYFYEFTNGDYILDHDWSAEVRIVTKTVPVTVIP
jgi:hypothetical protein